ncbi:MAG: phosphoribosylformylglycinamidine synthase subunit PurQ [Pseudomonadota bacterium]
MRTLVIQFPDSNGDRDAVTGIHAATGHQPSMVWYRETALPQADLIVLPGGFSFGDYLRPGAMSANAPIMPAVKQAAEAGVPVMGICNGFQILTEAGLLPGALIRNASLRFVARDVEVRVETNRSPFTDHLKEGTVLTLPVAHMEGNYVADADTLSQLEDEERVAFRYSANPNGSANDIAGIMSANRRVLGLMPHPERASDPALGRADGATLFQGMLEAVA